MTEPPSAQPRGSAADLFTRRGSNPASRSARPRKGSLWPSTGSMLSLVAGAAANDRSSSGNLVPTAGSTRRWQTMEPGGRQQHATLADRLANYPLLQALIERRSRRFGRGHAPQRRNAGVCQRGPARAPESRGGGRPGVRRVWHHRLCIGGTAVRNRRCAGGRRRQHHDPLHRPNRAERRRDGC